MSLIDNLTADQVALFGCGLAFLFCLAILVVTPNVRSWFKRDRSQSPSRTPSYRRDKQVPTP
jgi:hypothetical protein